MKLLYKVKLIYFTNLKIEKYFVSNDCFKISSNIQLNL